MKLNKDLFRNTAIIISVITIANAAFAANFRAYFDYKVFYIPGQGPYLETMIEFAGDGLTYVNAGEDGTVKAEVATTIIIRRGEEVVDFRKFTISSPVIPQNGMTEDFMDIQRFSLPNGSYFIDVQMMDVHAESNEPQELSQPVTIGVEADLPYISDITFIKAYSQTDSPTELTKSGYDLLPYVSNYFPSDVSRLAFYVEVYNADAVFGASEKYALTYFITQKGSDEVSLGIQKYQREEARNATPLLQILDISKLPTGNYELHVEMRDKENLSVASRTLSFFRNNYIEEEITPDKLAQTDVENTFVMSFTSRDSLKECIESTWPIMTNLERNATQFHLENADITILRQFFLTFWERRDPEDPAKAWTEYAKEVEKVEKAYGTRVKKGYQTDRGRVYLQYGAPNTIAVRHNDLDAYPYEIWHYYKAARFSNKRFLFYNPDLITNDFQLLHSDMQGEPKNDNWVLLVLSRNNAMGDVTRQSVDNGASRVLIDLWNNPR